jgi:peptide deformylase
MSIRPVMTFPHPTLLRRAAEVTMEGFGAKLVGLSDDMAETMYASNGIGLAAPQIDVPIRMLVMDTEWPRQDDSTLHVLVNPEIVSRAGEMVYEEGCLSFPELQVPVRRSAEVKVKARDARGRPVTLEAEGLEAVCLQHEMDHLDGVTLVHRAEGEDRVRLIAEMRQQPWFNPELLKEPL